MNESKDESETLRRLLDGYLLKAKSGQGGFSSIYYFLKEEVLKAGLRMNPNVLVEHWAHLVRIGALATTGGDTNNANFPGYTVTARGMELLQKGQDFVVRQEDQR